VAFSLGVAPPRQLRLALTADARRVLGVALVVLVVSLAAFIDAVHLGHEVTGTQGDTFLSRFTGAELLAATTSPARADGGRFAAENFYFSEGAWHVQHRNRAAGDGDLWTAWHENVILEEFYPLILQAGARWPDEQRANAASAVAAHRRPYASAAYPYPMFTTERWAFWLGVLVIVAMVVGVSGALSLVNRRRHQLPMPNPQLPKER
jgi:hypothetical protein